MSKETWRDIQGYEGYYRISNWGRVQSLRGIKILKPLVVPNGYEQVSLSVNGIRRQVSVHRLVAHAFLGPCPDGQVVNHKNGKKADNRADNLEYCTQRENDQHSRRVLGHDRQGESNSSAKLTDEDVRKIRQLYATGNYSQPQLAAKFGVKQVTIWHIIHRHNWKHI